MNIEILREYCLSKKGASESLPFNDDVLVYKVMDKMFAFTSLSRDLFVTLKCDPEKCIELREQYPCVQPGYHMNKKYWNTVALDGSVSDKLIFEWIDHSYEQVVQSLTKEKIKKLKSF
jgi:predicted DNA-binding protein (MmcQ/YjbR family)